MIEVAPLVWWFQWLHVILLDSSFHLHWLHWFLGWQSYDSKVCFPQKNGWLFNLGWMQLLLSTRQTLLAQLAFTCQDGLVFKKHKHHNRLKDISSFLFIVDKVIGVRVQTVNWRSSEKFFVPLMIRYCIVVKHISRLERSTSSFCLCTYIVIFHCFVSRW